MDGQTPTDDILIFSLIDSRNCVGFVSSLKNRLSLAPHSRGAKKWTAQTT